MFKDYTIFEKLFLLLGTMAAFGLTWAFKGTWIDLGYTFLYFWTALLLINDIYGVYNWKKIKVKQINKSRDMIR